MSKENFFPHYLYKQLVSKYGKGQWYKYGQIETIIREQSNEEISSFFQIGMAMYLIESDFSSLMSEMNLKFDWKDLRVKISKQYYDLKYYESKRDNYFTDFRIHAEDPKFDNEAGKKINRYILNIDLD